MAQRFIHYEAAFEDFLRSRAWPYLCVDEHRKAIFSGARVKSFDVLVYPPGGTAWMVDVKGRKFPYEIRGGKRFWENWVTQEDLDGLKQWESAFGAGFQPVFVFAYWLLGLTDRGPTAAIHPFRRNYYAFLAIPAATYASHARRRSDRWNTVSMPHRAFRSLAIPLTGS
jgi:hypothetical protein